MRTAWIVLILIFAVTAAFAATSDGRPGAVTGPLYKSYLTASDPVTWGYFYTEKVWKRLPVGEPIWRNANGEPQQMISCRNTISFYRKGESTPVVRQYVYVPVEIPIERIVEKIVEKPVEVEKIVKEEVISYVFPPQNAAPMSAMPAPNVALALKGGTFFDVGPGNTWNVAGGMGAGGDAAGGAGGLGGAGGTGGNSSATGGNGYGYGAAAAAAAAAASSTSTAVTPTSGAAAQNGSTSGTSSAAGGEPTPAN